MQDKYAGDVGDFGKFSLLRALAPGLRLGIGWYRTEGHREVNNDGRHLRYLDRPERFRGLDGYAFDTLKSFRESFDLDNKVRTIKRLEGCGLLPPETLFHSEVCPNGSPNAESRRSWADGMVLALSDAAVVFVDPDNGIEPRAPNHKHALFAEIAALGKPGRALVVYHHQTRVRGGAQVEVESLRRRLQDQMGTHRVSAVRLKPYSSRIYFVLDADIEISARLSSFGARWARECELFL